MSASKSQLIIKMTVDSIKNDNVNNLKKFLGVMPLKKLKRQANTLLALFLGTASEYGRLEAANIILNEWRDIFPFDNVEPISQLFTINQIDISTLAYVVLNNKDYTYIELMDDLIIQDNSEEIITACSKADKIFGPQSYEVYKIVKDHADEMGNWRVSDYAVASMEEVAPFKSKPDWVKNYTDKDLVPESQLYDVKTGDINFSLPSDEKAVELLTEGLSQMGMAVNNELEAKQYLYEVLKNSTDAQKRELLRPVIENQIRYQMGGDEWLFRVFGPANPLVNQDLTQPGPSNKYGGCRMFLCDVFDYDDEFDYVADWFTGSCETCHLRIKHRWYAVRKPRPHGGWSGCYCSWDCTRKSIFENEQEPDLLTHELINIFEKEINEIGIQDRI